MLLATGLVGLNFDIIVFNKLNNVLKSLNLVLRPSTTPLHHSFLKPFMTTFERGMLSTGPPVSLVHMS